MTDEEFDEFVSNIDRSGGARSCHVWIGAAYEAQGGYGVWRGEGAHRVAYRLKNGAIPDGKVVRHTCDNPPCCNPAHLLLGEHEDNRADCVNRKRHARGNQHPQAKLTARQVRFIRTHHNDWSHQKIAEKYGVSRSTITRIRNGQGWDGVGVPRSEEPQTTS